MMLWCDDEDPLIVLRRIILRCIKTTDTEDSVKLEEERDWNAPFDETMKRRKRESLYIDPTLRADSFFNPRAQRAGQWLRECP